MSYRIPGELVQIAYRLRTLFTAYFLKFTINNRKSTACLAADADDRFIFRIGISAPVCFTNFYLYFSVFCMNRFDLPWKKGTLHFLAPNADCCSLAKDHLFKLWYILLCTYDIKLIGRTIFFHINREIMDILRACIEQAFHCISKHFSGAVVDICF